MFGRCIYLTLSLIPKPITMFTFRYEPCNKETLIKSINTYLKCNHINMTFYKKSLAYINKGFQPRFTFKNANDSYKIMKVIKVEKGNKY